MTGRGADVPAASRRGRAWPVRLGLVAGGLFLPLLAVELLFRLAGPVLPGNYDLGALIELHPTYRVFHPRDSVVWKKTSEFSARLNLNQHGLRGPDYQRDKPAGSFRIMLLGDSFVEAAQVEERLAVSSRLEARLSDLSSVDVLNAGVGGWGPVEQFLYFREEGRGFGPDLVLLAVYVGNDIGDAHHRWILLKRKAQRADTASGRPDDAVGRLDRILDRSYAFTAFKTGVLRKLRYERADESRLLDRRHAEPYSVMESRTIEDGYKAIRNVLALMQEQTRASGAELAVVLVPSYWQIYPAEWEAALQRSDLGVDRAWDLGRPNRRLREIAEAFQIETLDLLPRMRLAASDGQQLYFRLDQHWNAQGHAVAAEELAGFVRGRVAAARRVTGVDAAGIAWPSGGKGALAPRVR